MKNAALTCFGLIWTAMFLVFDGVVARGLIYQFHSGTFPSTTGTITHSEVTERGDGDGGTTYDTDLQYDYIIGKQAFVGRRIRYGAESSGCNCANETVASHPVGSPVKVFYNPRNPADSLLSPGLDGSDFMWAVFMTPFNMVMLAFWLAAGTILHAKFIKSPTGGVRVIRKGPRTHVRLPRVTPAAIGLIVTGLTSFVASFVLRGFDPGESLAVWALLTVYSTGCLAALWRFFRIKSGVADLIIDTSTATVELPAMFKRKERLRIPLSAIQEIKIVTIEHPDSEGGTTSYSYAPTLQTKDKARLVARLAEWTNRKRAETFTTWLRTELHLDKHPEYRPIPARTI